MTVADDGEFFEYFPHFAKSIVCGFSRIGGETRRSAWSATSR